MVIQKVTAVQLQAEGITDVEYLAYFDKETIKQIADNLRLPNVRVADPNPGAAAGATILTPTFVLGSKSQQISIHYTKIVWHYDTIGRATTASNIQWTPAMKNFSQKWKYLEDKKIGDK